MEGSNLNSIEMLENVDVMNQIIECDIQTNSLLAESNYALYTAETDLMNTSQGHIDKTFSAIEHDISSVNDNTLLMYVSQDLFKGCSSDINFSTLNYSTSSATNHHNFEPTDSNVAQILNEFNESLKFYNTNFISELSSTGTSRSVSPTSTKIIDTKDTATHFILNQVDDYENQTYHTFSKSSVSHTIISGDTDNAENVFSKVSTSIDNSNTETTTSKENSRETSLSGNSDREDTFICNEVNDNDKTLLNIFENELVKLELESLHNEIQEIKSPCSPKNSQGINSNYSSTTNNVQEIDFNYFSTPKNIQELNSNYCSTPKNIQEIFSNYSCTPNNADDDYLEIDWNESLPGSSKSTLEVTITNDLCDGNDTVEDLKNFKPVKISPTRFRQHFESCSEEFNSSSAQNDYIVLLDTGVRNDNINLWMKNIKTENYISPTTVENVPEIHKEEIVSAEPCPENEVKEKPVHTFSEMQVEKTMSTEICIKNELKQKPYDLSVHTFPKMHLEETLSTDFIQNEIKEAPHDFLAYVPELYLQETVSTELTCIKNEQNIPVHSFPKMHEQETLSTEPCIKNEQNDILVHTAPEMHVEETQFIESCIKNEQVPVHIIPKMHFEETQFIGPCIKSEQKGESSISVHTFPEMHVNDLHVHTYASETHAQETLFTEPSCIKNKMNQIPQYLPVHSYIPETRVTEACIKNEPEMVPHDIPVHTLPEMHVEETVFTEPCFSGEQKELPQPENEQLDIVYSKEEKNTAVIKENIVVVINNIPNTTVDNTDNSGNNLERTATELQLPEPKTENKVDILYRQEVNNTVLDKKNIVVVINNTLNSNTTVDNTVHSENNYLKRTASELQLAELEKEAKTLKLAHDAEENIVVVITNTPSTTENADYCGKNNLKRTLSESQLEEPEKEAKTVKFSHDAQIITDTVKGNNNEPVFNFTATSADIVQKGNNNEHNDSAFHFNDENLSFVIFGADETADFNDPKWDFVKDLKTNEDYFESVRRQWRSHTLPNPHQDLTRRFVSDCPDIYQNRKRYDNTQAMSCIEFYNSRIISFTAKLAAAHSKLTALTNSNKLRRFKRQERVRLINETEQIRKRLDDLEKSKEELKQINMFYYEHHVGWDARFLNFTELENMKTQDKVLNFFNTFYNN